MQVELFEPVAAIFCEEGLKPLSIGGKEHRITPVFRTYWRFAAERQAIFLRRLNGILPTTSDPILSKFKFTNAYRVLDRTTQCLVRDVIGGSEQTPAELFFRIVLFKLFNKIGTWELLSRHFGDIRFADFRFDLYDHVLTDALAKGDRIYSAAYIMPSGGPNGESKKHRSHLRLLETMMKEDVPQKLRDSESMSAGFNLLRSYPMIGNFLAYQFITDINYSELTNYSEMEFVVPGPGALDGLKKCFPSMLFSEAASLIRFMCENQSSFQAELGLDPITLWGRPLQLIDCQNLFCETDKYARIAYPEIAGFSGRTRIKQSFRMTGPIQNPVLPSKWGIDTCTVSHVD
jgi:hypothetical protein